MILHNFILVLHQNRISFKVIILTFFKKLDSWFSLQSLFSFFMMYLKLKLDLNYILLYTLDRVLNFW